MHEIKAPFSEAQIKAIEDWQRWGSATTLRCPKHAEAKLVAKTDGLHCPVDGCGHVRDWAPRFILDVKYCHAGHPRPADASPAEYWIHVDAVESDPGYDGSHVPFHCPNCGLDFTVEI